MADSLKPEFLNRSFPLLTPEGIRHLATRKVVIAGCGGVGGALAVTLARMGVGQFSLADPANFDLPDLNRQWGAFNNTLGTKKVDVYHEMITNINRDIKIKKFDQGITEHNQDEFLDGAHILVDCLDVSVAHALRESLHQKARLKKMFACVAPVIGFGCAAICSSPDGDDMQFWTDSLKNTTEKQGFPEAFNKIFMPEQLDIIGKSLQIGRVPTVAAGPLIATSLLSTECIAYLLDGIIPGSRKPIALPKIMLFDLLRMSYYVVDVRLIA